MARFDRRTQLAQLESVIESKKREIQEKLEAQKRKETEDALKKIQTQPVIPPRRPFWKRNQKLDKESSSVDSGAGNVFTNDGSFLDKFKKLSQTGLKPDKVDVETLAKAREVEEQEKERKRRLEEEKAQKELERRAWEREREFRKIEREQERELRARSRDPQWHATLSTDELSPRTSLSSGIKLNLPPPGMVQIIPQVQLVTPIVLQQPPQTQHLMMNPPPQFTTNEIQMQANSGFTGPLPLSEISLPDTSQPPPVQPMTSYPPPQQIPIPSNLPPVPHVHTLPPPPISSIPIPPPLQMNPQLMPPPSHRSQSIPSPTYIPLASIPSPPSSSAHPDLVFQPKKLSGIPFFDIEPAHDPAGFIPLPKHVNLPSANCEATLDSGSRHLALMVAKAGDHVEDILRERNEDDPSLRFLFEPESLKYKQFRQLVEDYRSGKAEEYDSEPEGVVIEDSDSNEDVKNSDDGDKYDPMALSDDSDDELSIIKEEGSKKTSGLFQLDNPKVSSYKNEPKSEDFTEDNYDQVPGNIKRESDNRSSFQYELKRETSHYYTEDNYDEVPRKIKREEEQARPSFKYEPKTESSQDYTEDNYDEVPRKLNRNEDSRPSFSGAGISFQKKHLEFVSAASSQTHHEVEKVDTKRRKRSRWGEKSDEPGNIGIPLPQNSTVPSVGVATPSHLGSLPTMPNIPPPGIASSPLGIQLPPSMTPFSAVPPGQVMLSQITRRDPGLVAYARQTFGSTELSDEDWKRAEDHYKINLLYQDMMTKKAELEKLAKKGQFKYEYDSDEEVEGGTWEHKLRMTEMEATEAWAAELTRQAEGKHHIGDFLPPDELKNFMEKYNAVKEGREPDLSDYKEYKLKEDNVGYQLLQKMGWSEGQGLGQEGQGIVDPVNKASNRLENQGLGIDRSDGLYAGDDEYTAYRKRMMLAYRFRPNPLNNPRRPYY